MQKEQRRCQGAMTGKQVSDFPNLSVPSLKYIETKWK